MKHFPQPLTREALGARCDRRQEMWLDDGHLTVFYRVSGEWDLPDSGPSIWEHDLTVIGCAFDPNEGENVMLTEDEATERFGQDVMEYAEDLAMEDLE